MSSTTPRALRRLDYRPYPFVVRTIHLDFDLAEDGAVVAAEIRFERNPGAEPSVDLRLDGVGLELMEIALDGEALPAERYGQDDEGITVRDVGESPVLRTVVKIHPETNTRLEGLYRSAGFFLTQCEAEGFRHITFYPDRPDVLARYTVTLRADKARYPVLLGNGNPLAARDLDGGRHEATWEDPFPKPSYLFALVAGDLAHIERKFATMSGREVTARIYTEAKNIDRCDHAMDSLIHSMEWDEKTFGLECDLDHYNVVVTDDFNMGAMENKGLNVFNSKYVLARPDTATDGDYAAIEAVIGHEYFHNWTGNRITCRDWFQLSLKEGLTVLRDQLFSADMGSEPVERISQVRTLRAAQFAEDAGPQAHPVRPDEVVEINNFYTTTVYEKGAEVVRMYRSLLGAEGFRKGMDLYVQRHDGQACTCEDFAAAMADASGRDLLQFLRWYSQAGTPRVAVSARRDGDAYVLAFEQSCPATPGQAEKLPFHIPIRMGLIDRSGVEVPGSARLVELTETRHEERFEGVPDNVVPSLLRGFSAPVILEYPYSHQDLALLMAKDTDPFQRWDAGQRLMLEVLLGQIRAGAASDAPDDLATGWRSVLTDEGLDPALRAEALVLPGETYLGDQVDVVDPDLIHGVRRGVRRELAVALRSEFERTFQGFRSSEPYRFDAAAVGRRSLGNLSLAYLAAGGHPGADEWTRAQFESADNMTDSFTALSVLTIEDLPGRDEALQQFFERWCDDPLVLDKWFALQASQPGHATLGRVRELMELEQFSLTNPNRVRSLIGAFARNPTAFHGKDGAGYRFVADIVLELDAMNPQIAARMTGVFDRWKRFGEDRRDLQRSELQRIRENATSKDVGEIAGKSLAE